MIEVLNGGLQGAEFEAIQSLGDYLEVVESGVIECARHAASRMYKGGAILSEVVQFLLSNSKRVFSVVCNDRQCNEVNVWFTSSGADVFDMYRQVPFERVEFNFTCALLNPEGWVDQTWTIATDGAHPVLNEAGTRHMD